MDLSTTYAGLQLGSPVVIGSCPLSLDLEQVRLLVDAGAGAVVLPSVFEEQIVRDRFGFLPTDAILWKGSETMATADPDWDRYNGGTESYLESIVAIRNAIGVPVIASVNCVSDEGWSDYVKRIEDAGADAIEVNLFHYEVDPDRFADDVERDLLARIKYVRDSTCLPISVKLLPSFTSLANFVCRLSGAGAKSVCVFGQAPVFEPCFDEDSEQQYACHWRLTNHSDLRVALDAVHLIHNAVPQISIAACGGVQDADDAIAAIQLGADVVMIASAVYRKGPPLVAEICKAIEKELIKHRCGNLQEFVGSKFCGFDAFPLHTRRQQYASAVTRLLDVPTASPPSVPERPADGAL
jgi:dihydroorotate dehydrogenase (fumarate)